MLNPAKLYASKGPKHPQYACLSAMPEDESILAIYSGTVLHAALASYAHSRDQRCALTKLPDSAVKPMRAMHVLGSV